MKKDNKKPEPGTLKITDITWLNGAISLTMLVRHKGFVEFISEAYAGDIVPQKVIKTSLN